MQCKITDPAIIYPYSPKYPTATYKVYCIAHNRGFGRGVKLTGEIFDKDAMAGFRQLADDLKNGLEEWGCEDYVEIQQQLRAEGIFAATVKKIFARAKGRPRGRS